MKKSLVPSAYDFLSKQQKKLVDAFVDPNNEFDQMSALENAGYDRYSATRSARNPFQNINVRRAISEKIKPTFDSQGITFEENFKFVSAIAYGDVNELVETKLCNCRYCHGIMHKYQWSESEYQNQLEEKVIEFKKIKNLEGLILDQSELEEMGFIPPACDGGFGFNKWESPDEMCTECHGHGVQHVYIHPQYLSHPLYAGAEVDKNGNIKINIRSQDNALKLVSQLAGFLVEKIEIKEVITADHLAEKRKRAQERKDARNAEAKKQTDIT